MQSVHQPNACIGFTVPRALCTMYIYVREMVGAPQFGTICYEQRVNRLLVVRTTYEHRVKKYLLVKT